MNKRRVTLRSVNLALSLGTVYVMLVLVSFPLQPAHGQLRELEVKPEDPPPAIPVFRNFPDHAGVIIYSSITNLDITSNMGIVEDMSRPQDGRYIVIVGAYRQVLTVRAPGFQETRIQIPNMSAREVAYFSVEPREREPVEGRGTLVLRSIPEGARIIVDGYPDLTQQTPYTYELPAQSYRMRVELNRYEPKELVISVPDGQVLSRTLELVPTFGFITIHAQGILRVRYHGEGSLSRISYTPGRPLELPVGSHTLELSRDNYETETAGITVAPGERAAWRPDSRPTYGRLRVRANTQVRVDVADNQAPAPPPGANYLYVESGRKQVRVTAPNYIAADFSIDMPAGGQIDTTVTLLSIAESQDLERRRGQPRGVIRVASDLAATEIWVNGEMAGRGFANVTVLTGTHDIEFRHAIRTQHQRIYVAPAEVEHVFVELRPSRARAVTLGALLPGSGHIYTNRNRGYIYGGAFGLTVAGSAAMWLHYDSINNDYKTALQQYQSAGSLEMAAEYHNQVLGLHNDRLKAFEYFEYLVYASAAIYALNVLDILITRPAYGYRTGKPPEGFSVGAIPGPTSLPTASLTWHRSF